MKLTPLTRRQANNRLCVLAHVPRYAAAFDHGMRRGRCARKGCESRLAIPRVTFDFRHPEAIEQAAELVCVTCDRVWGSIKVPDIRSHKNHQRVRITLILPPTDKARTWVRHGAVHRVGDDAAIIADANYTLLMEAQAEWRVRSDRRLDAKARAKARKLAQSEADMAEWRERMAAVEANRAAREEAARELGI